GQTSTAAARPSCGHIGRDGQQALGVGMAKGSPRNPTEVEGAAGGGRAPPERSRLWWSEWQKRTGIGAIGGSRAHYPIWGTKLPAARSQRFWNGTASSRRRSGAGRRPGRNFWLGIGN